MKKNIIVLALISAAFLLMVSFGLKYLVSTGQLSADVSERALGVIVGLYLAVTGNYMPKTLYAGATRECDSSKAISLRRFGGWVFVLAGLSYAAIWLTVPIEHAATLSIAVVAGGTSMVVIPFIWLIITRKRRRLAVKD